MYSFALSLFINIKMQIYFQRKNFKMFLVLQCAWIFNFTFQFILDYDVRIKLNKKKLSVKRRSNVRLNYYRKEKSRLGLGYFLNRLF